MTVTVWTERRTSGAWDQCSECGYLMGLVHGGFTKFPAGIYTDRERDELTAMEFNRAARRSAGLPMFPLIDDAAQRRYGLRLRTVTGTTTRATDAQLQKALQTPGNCVVLPGNYVGLVDGHFLRRWQPGFEGGHMVAVVVRPDLKLLWLDPLATKGYPGDVTTVVTAMAFAFSNNDAHVVRAGEFAALPATALEDDDVDPDRYRPVASAVFRGGTIYKDPDRKAAYPTPLLGPTRLEVIALPRQPLQPDGRAALAIVVVDTLGGTGVDNELGYLGVDQIDPDSWTPIAWTPSSLALENKLRAARTALAGLRQVQSAEEVALAAAEQALI